jgi:hypothetical protein
MITVARQLKETIERAKPDLLAIAETRAAEKPYPDKWSLKEILGHLIDSAANNHQRIVRMQEVADIGTFVYSQEQWVRSQNYVDEPWADLVAFWHSYNKHIAHVVAYVDEDTLQNMCDMGYSEPATLRFVIEDYVRHVQHHLDQIFADVSPRERTQWKQRNPSGGQERE